MTDCSYLPLKLSCTLSFILFLFLTLRGEFIYFRKSMKDSLHYLGILESNSNNFNILLAAFAGAVVGGLFTLISAYFHYKITKHQLKIQIIHANKINELLNFQNALVEILTLLPSLGLLIYEKNMNKDYDHEKYQIQYDQLYLKLTNIKHRIPFLIK